MKLPHIFEDILDADAPERWTKQFVEPGRTVLEGIWRRTQDVRIREKSGWQNASDLRRKMVHYMDRFDVQDEEGTIKFKLLAPYLWVHYAFPVEELEQFDQRVQDSLKDWMEESPDHFRRGDLTFVIDHDASPLDPATFPKEYGFRTYVFGKDGETISEEKMREPWDVLKTGIRKPLTAGNPKRTKNIEELREFLPAHIELGCGPSTEAGIPPLHYLHNVFGISDPGTGKFILDLSKDRLVLDMLEDPVAFFERSSLPYRKALQAPVTDFYRGIKKLYDQGLLFKPVITNNFDGFPAAVGMEEQYVRRYAEAHIIPKMNFDPRAKALIVVGSHADRRRTHEAARNVGLKVIYVDPENFGEENRAYPLEAPQDEDIVINMTAQEFADGIKAFLK